MYLLCFGLMVLPASYGWYTDISQKRALRIRRGQKMRKIIIDTDVCSDDAAVIILTGGTVIPQPPLF